MNFYIDEDFTRLNHAYLNVDMKTNYGYPSGTKTNRAPKTIELIRSGPQRYNIDDMSIAIENPLVSALKVVVMKMI